MIWAMNLSGCSGSVEPRHLTYDPLPPSPEAGEAGQLVFTSDTAHANPFDVELRAVFTQNRSQHTFWGFYAGANAWHVRFNVAHAGDWTYRLESSDAALDGLAGSITVLPPAEGHRGRLLADGRALRWQHTGEPFIIAGHTAYALLQEDAPWRECLDWTAANGLNYIRVDAGSHDIHGSTNRFWRRIGARRYSRHWLWGGTPSRPDWTVFNLAQWDRLDALIIGARERDLVLELSPKLLRQLPTPGEDQDRFIRYLAARTGAWPHITWVFDAESPARSGELATEAQIRAAGIAFASAFDTPPLLGLHLFRNHNYGGKASGYHSQRPTYHGDFRGEPWLTLCTMHESWKLEGYGMLEHHSGIDRPAFVAEAVYESRGGRVEHEDMTVLDAFGLRERIANDPRYYYRRYMIASLLSGGTGITYGLTGESPSYENQRWAYGLPDGGSAEGWADMPAVAAFFRSHRWNANLVDPLDTQISNGRTEPSEDVLSRELGLDRAKLCRLLERVAWIAYSPYPEPVTLQGVPAGLPVTAWIPATGQTLAHGIVPSNGPILPPTPDDDYVLVIGQP